MYTADSSVVGESFYARSHWHDAFEILHFEKGHFNVGVNMDNFQIDKESFCFVMGGSLHSVRCEGTFLEQAVVFDPSILSPENMDAAGRELIAPLVGKRMLFPVLIDESSPAFPEIRREYQKICSVYKKYGEQEKDQINTSSASAQLRIKASLMNMLAILSEEELLTFSDDNENPRVEALKSVMTYISANYTSKIYNHELAAIMNMNEQYFCRFFKKAIGKTPVAYINEVRIRNAILLLQNTEDSVMDVAISCGFNNMGHFIEEFRRATGLAPLEFRKNHKEGTKKL